MAWQEVINFTNDSMNARSRDAFATAYGYQATINGQPNPETKAQFRARKIKQYIKEITFSVENTASEAARVRPTVED